MKPTAPAADPNARAEAAKALFVQASDACSAAAWGQAEQLLQAHLQLRPGSAAGLALLAMVWGQTGRSALARDLWQQLLAARADYAEGWCHLGFACESLRDWPAALQAFERALRLAPNALRARIGTGLVLQKQGQHREALAAFDSVLSAQPSDADTWFHRAESCLALGDGEGALTAYDQALAADAGHQQAASNRLLSMLYIARRDGVQQSAAARAWGRALEAQVASLRPSLMPDTKPERILRVGLVSADLRAHPVAYFLGSVLEALDRAQVELFAYANHTQPDDDWTRRLRACVPHWQAVAYWSDAHLVRQIQHDAIDILIDLSGHTAGQRLAVFAAQPAPIQCSWLGYPGTTGLSRMDYVFVDAWAVPPDEQGAFSETVWQLANTRQCYTPPTDAPAVQERGAQERLVLGCFQNVNKMDDGVLHCWAQILCQLPTAQLLLHSHLFDQPQVRQAFEARLQRCGVSLGQLRLVGAVARADYWTLLGSVDLLLDTFPYGGCTTTLEGLWMGVPTLTLGGPGLHGRQGESLLRNLGLDAWVTDSPACYVQQAVAWAARREELVQLRARLRPQLHASVLCDASTFSQNLVGAWRAQWRHFCQGKPATEPVIEVRRLLPAHASAYRACMLHAYAETPDAFTSSVAERAAFPLCWWEQRLAANPAAPTMVIGVFCNGALVGAAGLSMETREKSRHKATLFGMTVNPRHRGQGLGRRLVQAVLDFAHGQPGLRLMQLTVTQGNVAAQTLYARMGFVTFGLEPMAMATPGGFVDKVHMWRKLSS